jgi:hypothetical protein
MKVPELKSVYVDVCRKNQILDGSRCRDLMLPLFPLFLFLEDVIIFDIVEYIIMQWTIPNVRVGNPSMQDM